MVLEDVVEYEYTASGRKEVRSFTKQLDSCNHSLISFPNVHTQTALDQILLNGANICMMIPGGSP